MQPDNEKTPPPQPVDLTERDIQRAAKAAVDLIKKRGYGVAYPLAITGMLMVTELSPYTDAWDTP